LHHGERWEADTLSRKSLGRMAANLLTDFDSAQASAEDADGRTLTVLKVGTEVQVSQVLEKIARSKGEEITSIALAYILHKSPYVFPIVGGRKVSHLRSNVAALQIALTAEEIDDIDNASGFRAGFPHNVVHDGTLNKDPDIVQSRMRGPFDFVQDSKPIVPHATKL
jgi:hypothetical protein